MRWNLVGIDGKQERALNAIQGIIELRLSPIGTRIQMKKGGKGICLQASKDGNFITYEKDHQFIRAVVLFIERYKKEREFCVTELPVYDDLGIMVDCARNSVFSIDGFRKFIQYLAIMGYSSFQLYLEDLFDLPGYPYFGYMRGRYSKEQLYEMDHYAALFGIELIPAIQTLAHLKQALKWRSMNHFVDTDDILMIGEEDTYQMIDAMFKQMRECFQTKRINIGMDEAHMVGRGRYLDEHGLQDRTELMIYHLKRVEEIAQKYQFEPMMWGDMFFRIANGGQYYNTESAMAEDIKEKMPENITLIYWDYYSEEKEIYDKMIEKHKKISDRLVFAGGAWKWSGFVPNNYFSRKTGLLAHESCMEQGVKQVLLTLWGDDGGECSNYAVLPTLLLWAELCYENCAEERYLSKRFAFLTGCRYQDFMDLDKLNLTPGNPIPGRVGLNPAKYLFYQDVLLGIFDKHTGEEDKEWFEQCACELEKMKTRNGKFNYLFEVQALLAQILAEKCTLGREIRAAYRSEEREFLRECASHTLPNLIQKVEKFRRAYQVQWLKENKIFGLEAIEIRIGALVQRLSDAAERIFYYLDGNIPIIEEFEEELLYYQEIPEGAPREIRESMWKNIVTPSMVSHI